MYAPTKHKDGLKWCKTVLYHPNPSCASWAVCHTLLFFRKVNIQPGSHYEIADSLLSDVSDPSSNYSQMVAAAGDIQVVLAYTYTKASLINIPPDEVCMYSS